MSVTEVRLHSAGASGSVSGGKDAIVPNTSYTSRYRVKVDDVLDGPTAILSYFRRRASLPWIGRPFRFGHGFDVFSLCKSVVPNYVENSAGWFDVVCQFESENGKDQEQNQGPDGKASSDPTQWHDDIEISYTQISVPVEEAVFQGFEPEGINNLYLTKGKKSPVVNSANVTYDPTLEEEWDIKVIRLSRYVKNWDGSQGNKYQGAVNSDNVVISKPQYKFKESFKKYQGRIKNLGATFQIVNGIACYRQTLELHINTLPHGWRRVVLDRGVDRRAMPGDPDGEGGSISMGETIDPGKPYNAKIKDEDGYPITEAVSLNGNGQPLKPGQDPVYLVYQTRKEIPFAGIKW